MIFVNVIFILCAIRSSDNTILYIEDAQIFLKYEIGKSSITDQSKYDLLIITPRKFLLNVLPLKIHKNQMGIKTFVKTTESIYREYLLKGRDRPEKIKLYIKDAIENFGIKYVLLMGGRNNQRFSF